MRAPAGCPASGRGDEHLSSRFPPGFTITRENQDNHTRTHTHATARGRTHTRTHHARTHTHARTHAHRRTHAHTLGFHPCLGKSCMPCRGKKKNLHTHKENFCAANTLFFNTIANTSFSQGLGGTATLSTLGMDTGCGTLVHHPAEEELTSWTLASDSLPSLTSLTS